MNQLVREAVSFGEKEERFTNLVHLDALESKFSVGWRLSFAQFSVEVFISETTLQQVQEG